MIPSSAPMIVKINPNAIPALQLSGNTITTENESVSTNMTMIIMNSSREQQYL